MPFDVAHRHFVSDRRDYSGDGRSTALVCLLRRRRCLSRQRSFPERFRAQKSSNPTVSQASHGHVATLDHRRFYSRRVSSTASYWCPVVATKSLYMHRSTRAFVVVLLLWMPLKRTSIQSHRLVRTIRRYCCFGSSSSVGRSVACGFL
jgi:hypothetical protein